ncbi:class E sortase [Arthrobacter sp. PM3]|uniref:class E sortase n=1 Tax=Arthrobacter sp. PM3 TaxID=2017685 RepID=UPI000E1044B8|nr:class E sortase [Arthrobacter sp. PM3]AXJ09341.1 class E sortase [Arthrobacter sp. PM3]
MLLVKFEFFIAANSSCSSGHTGDPAIAHEENPAVPQLEQGSGRSDHPRGPVVRSAQIIGELLLTAGVILLLFVAWQLWWTNVDSDFRQRAAVRTFARQSAPVAPAATPAAEYGPAAVAPEPAEGATIGILYVPRFGAGYMRPVVQGTTPALLDTLGIGHYEGTAMPGAAGNFAVAGHRQTHGAVLDNIDSLVPGDRIYVQTREGYYVYVFRNSQIVLPARTDVLLPVPSRPGAVPTERYLTMTTCNPRFGSGERFVAYALLESWQPVSAGPPAEIAAQAARAAGEG